MAIFEFVLQVVGCYYAGTFVGRGLVSWFYEHNMSFKSSLRSLKDLVWPNKERKKLLEEFSQSVLHAMLFTPEKSSELREKLPKPFEELAASQVYMMVNGKTDLEQQGVLRLFPNSVVFEGNGQSKQTISLNYMEISEVALVSLPCEQLSYTKIPYAIRLTSKESDTDIETVYQFALVNEQAEKLLSSEDGKLIVCLDGKTNENLKKQITSCISYVSNIRVLLNVINVCVLLQAELEKDIYENTWFFTTYGSGNKERTCSLRNLRSYDRLVEVQSIRVPTPSGKALSMFKSMIAADKKTTSKSSPLDINLPSTSAKTHKPN